MSIKKVFFVFLFIEVMSGRLKGIVLSVKYAAIPVQLEIFILQYIGWCALTYNLDFYHQSIRLLLPFSDG